MTTKYDISQKIKQLEKRKGGYYYLEIKKEVVAEFSKQRKTRLVCFLDVDISYQCGLNHLGDGNFFIILGGKYLKLLNKKLGDFIQAHVIEDPNPLGVEVPEVLTVFLEQEPELKNVYDQLTDGKKRSLIFSFYKIKNIDLQLKKIRAFLVKEYQKK